MNLIYIDNNDVIGKLFLAAVNNISAYHSCVAFSECKLAVVHLLSSDNAPDYIFIHRNVVDISCIELIRFIRKQDKLSHAIVIVLAGRFGKKDLTTLTLSGVDQCIETTFNLHMLTHTIHSVISPSSPEKNLLG